MFGLLGWVVGGVVVLGVVLGAFLGGLPPRLWVAVSAVAYYMCKYKNGLTAFLIGEI